MPLSNRHGGFRKGAGRKPIPDPKQKQVIPLTPKAITIYETWPRGRKGDWVSRLIILNANAVIEPGTLVRPVGGVDTGAVVFCDDREAVVRWVAGLRVHRLDELEITNNKEASC